MVMIPLRAKSRCISIIPYVVAGSRVMEGFSVPAVSPGQHVAMVLWTPKVPCVLAFFSGLMLVKREYINQQCIELKAAWMHYQGQLNNFD